MKKIIYTLLISMGIAGAVFAADENSVAQTDVDVATSLLSDIQSQLAELEATEETVDTQEEVVVEKGTVKKVVDIFFKGKRKYITITTAVVLAVAVTLYFTRVRDYAYIKPCYDFVDNVAGGAYNRAAQVGGGIKHYTGYNWVRETKTKTAIAGGVSVVTLATLIYLSYKFLKKSKTDLQDVEVTEDNREVVEDLALKIADKMSNDESVAKKLKAITA